LSTKAQKPKENAGTISGLEYYRLADYRRLLWRHKWMMTTTALVVAVAVALGAVRLPNLYQANTEIIVDPGKVPDSYVKSTATIDASQRLAILEEQILSTTRLGQVIDEIGLYQSLKARLTRDDIVALMRKDIEVKPVTIGAYNKELQAFTVSFTSHSAPLAAKVSNRLASLFIEENMRVREQQVLGTADFFETELQKAQQDLTDKAQKLAQVRARYVSMLPASQNLQLQALTASQLELRSEMDAESRVTEQIHSLNAILADSPTVVNLDTTRASEDSGLQEELERLQSEMDQLRTRYGPDYPDVAAKTVEIEKIQKQISDAEKARPNSQATAAGGRRHNPVIESQLAALKDEVQRHQQRQRELKSQIEYYQSKLQSSPAAEQELAAATSDYNDAEDRYKRLEDRKFSADMSSEVETGQKGERFVIVEPAQAPEHANSPDRALIDLGGLGAGLAIALLLVVGREVINPAIKTTREVSEHLKVDVMGEIPWLITNSARLRFRLQSTLAAVASIALALGYADLLKAALQ
jgi:polysaccharide biosynthesis transport protein